MTPEPGFARERTLESVRLDGTEVGLLGSGSLVYG